MGARFDHTWQYAPMGWHGGWTDTRLASQLGAATQIHWKERSESPLEALVWLLEAKPRKTLPELATLTRIPPKHLWRLLSQGMAEGRVRSELVGAEVRYSIVAIRAE
jgi:hypothetical protein